MIVARAPMRISFMGGGSDLKAWLTHGPGSGAVLNTTIDKYVHVCMERHWDPDRIRLSYSTTENVDRLEHLQHDLLRTSLHHMGVVRGIEVVTIADLPGRGTGMGSSSAVTAGALLGLHRYLGIIDPSQAELVAMTVAVEQEAVGHHIGLQDQHAAVYGGLRQYRFHKDGAVDQELITNQMALQNLQDHMQLFWTGDTRPAASILRSVSRRVQTTSEIRDWIQQLVGLVSQARQALETGAMQDFGDILSVGWQLKRNTSPMVSTKPIDNAIQRGINAGAYGGKLLGAGGGGFILLITPPAKQPQVADAMALREIDVRIVNERARIIYDRGRPL
jgi:D-glycero-alpha-D-manno-heptose-7-phosphate kinase